MARIGKLNQKFLARHPSPILETPSLEPVQRKLPMSPSRRSDLQHDSQDFDSLLDLARTGDSDATGKLFAICQKYLLLIANQDLNPRISQKFGASDVVQQTMLIANREITGFRGNTKAEFLTWMKAILLNECRQSSRKYVATAKRSVNRERSIVSEVDDDAPVIDLRDPHLTPSTQASTGEQTALLQKALLEMDPLDRSVIEMRNWQELSFFDIGSKIGKSDEAARKIWSRAILKLEKWMKDAGAL